MRDNSKNKKKHPGMQLVAGGAAGFIESSICHPLDTIKTRMQLRRQQSTMQAVRTRSSMVDPTSTALRTRALSSLSSLAEPPIALDAATSYSSTSTSTTGSSLRTATLHEPAAMTSSVAAASPRTEPRVVHLQHGSTVMAPMGPIGTARRIFQREGPMALYKGLTAVWMGIIPKMAIRFVSFEQYRDTLSKLTNNNSNTPIITFSAGLMSGLTEAILVVTPAEVCKIRMQSQYHSLIDSHHMHNRKYTNVAQTAITIIREEGIAALYQGLVPTMMRQGCNQAANFSAYNYFKSQLLTHTQQNDLLAYQSLLLGGISGSFGPMVNNPLDVVKTRMQKQVIHPGKTPKYTGLGQACVIIANEEGYAALWKGITPRLMRIIPGQAITFMIYEFVSNNLQKRGYFVYSPS